jgi:formiminotetrahydrofolate cyclodeaminase
VNLPLDNETKKLVAAWIAQQGVPTILLFCILGFLAYSMVVLIPEVDKKRSEEIAQRISDLVTRQNEAITKMVESHDKDRELFIELMRDRLPAKPSPSEVR